MTNTYDGERQLGGQLVYGPDDEPLATATDVLSLAPGGFDWGPDAADERLLQLAVAILAEKFSKHRALDHHHTVATWLVDEIGDVDEWTIPTAAITTSTYREVEDPAFENRAPTAEDVTLSEVDPDTAPFGTIRALCEQYDLNAFDDEDRLRTKLAEIKTGAVDPDDVGGEEDDDVDPEDGGGTAEESTGVPEDADVESGDDDVEVKDDDGTDPAAADGGTSAPAPEAEPAAAGDTDSGPEDNAPEPAAIGTAPGDEVAAPTPDATQSRAAPPAEPATVQRRGNFDMVDIPGAAPQSVAVDYEDDPVPRVMIRTPEGADVTAMPEGEDSDMVVLSVELTDALDPKERTVLGSDDERTGGIAPVTQQSTEIQSADEFQWGATD